MLHCCCLITYLRYLLSHAFVSVLSPIKWWLDAGFHASIRPPGEKPAVIRMIAYVTWLMEYLTGLLPVVLYRDGFASIVCSCPIWTLYHLKIQNAWKMWFDLWWTIHGSECFIKQLSESSAHLESWRVIFGVVWDHEPDAHLGPRIHYIL
jgi:hypothetical protein